MSRSLEMRVKKLMDRMGDPNSVETRCRNMSDEELSSTIKALLLDGGYDPTLPHEEAQAAYVAKLEDELPSLGDKEAELQRKIIESVKGDLDNLRIMFPESPRSAAASPLNPNRRDPAKGTPPWKPPK